MSDRNGWADGRKIGRAEMRRLIRRRLRKLVFENGYESPTANTLYELTQPSREER